MSLDKPLGEHTAEECLAQIVKRVDRDTEVGKDIDMLAGQMAILEMNATTRCQRADESADYWQRHHALAAAWIRHLLAEHKGRKTLPYEAVEQVYREHLR
jgi:hypothetical protein